MTTENIQNLKDTALLMHNIAVEKQNALEKMRSNQTLVYDNHIFKADQQTISLTHCLLQNNKNGIIYILDVNNNPCKITNSKDFFDKLIEKNQQSINDLHQFYERFKKKLK
jgi:hypothetical protein